MLCTVYALVTFVCAAMSMVAIVFGLTVLACLFLIVSAVSLYFTLTYERPHNEKIHDDL